MQEKSSDSNVSLLRRRRDGGTDVAEPCYAQLHIAAPMARQRMAVNRTQTPRCPSRCGEAGTRLRSELNRGLATVYLRKMYKTNYNMYFYYFSKTGIEGRLPFYI